MAETAPQEDRVWNAVGESGTEAVGAELVSLLPAGTPILLEGDLGAGKTVLVRGMCVALGVDRRQVQSPSYALIHEYDGDGIGLVHVDLYRLEPEEVPALGLDELLAGPDWKAIEWAERLPNPPRDGRGVRIEVSGPEERKITLFAEAGRPAAVSGTAGD